MSNSKTPQDPRLQPAYSLLPGEEWGRPRLLLLIYATIWGFMLVAGATAVAALAWSINRGHMRKTRAQATSIFDLDDTQEPASQAGSMSLRGE